MKDLVQEEKKYDLLYRICLLMVLTVCMFIMFGTGGNLKKFYNDGLAYRGIKIYDFIGLGNALETEQGNILSPEGAYYYIEADDIDGSWRYVEIDVKYLSVSSVMAEIQILNDKNQQIEYGETCNITEGKNIIQMEDRDDVAVRIMFYGDGESTIALDEIYLKNNLMSWNWTYAILGAAVSAIVLAFVLRYISLYRLAGDLISVVCVTYGKALERAQMWTKISEKKRHWLRIAGFFFCILYLTVSVNVGLRSYDTRVFFFLFFLLGLLTSEKSGIHLAWNTPTARHWMLVCIWLIISDVLVSKTVMWTGYLWLIAFGFFIYAWNGRNESHIIVEELESAILLSYICLSLFCLLCRPDNTERYMGAFRNPNMFGFYLIVVLCVCLDKLNQYVYQKKKYCWAEIMEIISIFFWVWKTQARTAIVAIGILGFFWILEKCFVIKRAQWKRQRVMMLLIGLFLVVPVWNGMEWGVSNIPDKLGTGIIMERDLFLPISEEVSTRSAGNIFIDVVYAGNGSVFNRNNNSTINAISSGRIGIWMDFLKEVNLVGHRANAGNYTYGAHNLVLGIVYRYGVLALVPYVFMWLSVFGAAWNAMVKRKEKHGYFFLAIMLSYCWMAALNDIERSCSYFIWVCAYVLMGFFFFDRTKGDTTHTLHKTK